MKGPFNDLQHAIKEFTKKFKEKTKNNWEDREDFQPAKGKYTLLEMDGQDEAENIEEKVSKLLINVFSTGQQNLPFFYCC